MSRQEVIAFLKGEGTLDGVWFGEKHPTERGMFWWRNRLSELDTEPRAGDEDACSDPRGHAWRIPVEGNSTCVFCPAIKSDWPELAAQRNEGDGS